MNNSKQKLLLEYLLSSSDTFAICQSIVKPDYFDVDYRQAIAFIKHYYNEYNTTPTPEQVQAETGIELETQKITPDQIEYTTKEIETFCQRRAVEKVIMHAAPLIEKGEYANVESQLKDAILISLNRNLGLRYFDEVDNRLQRMLDDTPVEPTGWDCIDELLFGGISRKELLLVSANSGGGKSITLANLGFNFLMRGLNVLYVSLELSEDVIAQRYDTMFTGISRRDWKQHVSEISTKVRDYGLNAGILDIIQLPSATKANQIEAFLKEYYLHYNMMPDLLIIDYLDKMSPNEKVDLSDVWTKDKLVSEQIRDLGVKYNMVVATASQLNRDAVKASHHDHSHIAGGISKINESDVYWSIVMTEAMKVKGEIMFDMQKTRNSDGVGKTVYLKWDSKHLRILDKEKDGALKFKGKEKSTTDDFVDVGNRNGSKLADLIDSNLNK